MLRFFLSRLIRLLPLMLVVATAVFFMAQLLPGDPAQVIAGEFASPELISQVGERLGLEDPLPTRYWRFIAGVATGDLGVSFSVRPGASVWNLVIEAMPVTISLGVLSLFLAITIGLPLGYLAAMRPDSVVDRVLTASASLVMSVPAFVLAFFLITIFALNLGWLPAIGYVPLRLGVLDWFKHLLLPSLSLAAIPAAQLARQTRGSLVDTLERDYIRAAVAKGLGERSVVWKHGFKNAANPVITVFGLQIIGVVAGAVLIERIFNMPGIGSLAVTATLRRDLPVLQGIVLVVAFVVVVVNSLIDAAYGYFAPRSRT